ncbi:MAG: 4-alpha-glucanotransferase [Actinomycetota bacterium]|nr:4-alpha-glucanotransferase [Actinomycetota bacterium]
MFDRSSGVLLHVTSLPSRFGIGDLGPGAFEWIDWLVEAGCRYWQVLPLGPTGFGNSPYSSFSSYAGNTMLISPQVLVEDGLLRESELAEVGSADFVDYEIVGESKTVLLRIAYSRLVGELRSDFEAFRRAEAEWLDDYSLFMALKKTFGEASWTHWPDSLRLREPSALAAAHGDLAEEVEFHSFGQFVFYRQLGRLRRQAADRGVRLIGDVPLYVAADSVDVWVNPELFTVDEAGEPTVVSGVPPDMFSDTGQRWGTPLYRWRQHEKDKYDWWFRRLENYFRQADVLRIDHFTGFIRYYEIDGRSPDAMGGTWRDGPGVSFFDELERRMGSRPFILEDLGPISDLVEVERRKLGYPGMAIAQEGFDRYPGNPDHPDSFTQDRVAYTGTHDNGTALGRLLEETEKYREEALALSGGTIETYAWDLVSAVWGSLAVIAVAPMQDLLGLGDEARMNYPGTAEGNWLWRMPPGAATVDLAGRLAALNRTSDRNF